jgi:hypothetical protein
LQQGIRDIRERVSISQIACRAISYQDPSARLIDEVLSDSVVIPTRIATIV